MSFGLKQNSYEAVLYVSRRKVLKEMLYSEFEAVLDGVVSDSDYRGQTCHAVYLKIDVRLNIQSAVFFCIDFDKQGNADRRWNLPLLSMAESAPVIAELNGKGVRICCRSRCRVAAQQEYLWEPKLEGESNMLAMLASSVKSNRLGLLVEEGADAAGQAEAFASPAQQDMGGAAQATGEAYEKAVATQQHHENEVRRLTENVQKQRMYIASLKARHEEDTESLRSQHEREKEVLLLQFEEACSTLKAVQQRNKELQEELQNASDQSSRKVEEYEKQLSANVNQQGFDFTELKKQFRIELQQKLIEQTSELKSKLDMRDVEAHYRDEQIKYLKQQLKESASAVAAYGAGAASQGNPAHNAIIELDSLGVSFVLTLPAVRPIKIPAADIETFCADPDEFIASRLGMEKSTYLAWIEHARQPLCVAPLTDDCSCGARLEIVHPKDFVPDFSNRCREHQQGASAQIARGM